MDEVKKKSPKNVLPRQDERIYKQVICHDAGRRVFVKGTVTETEYLFQSGIPVSVDIRDVPAILAIKSEHRTCCNNSGNDRTIFVQLD